MKPNQIADIRYVSDKLLDRQKSRDYFDITYGCKIYFVKQVQMLDAKILQHHLIQRTQQFSRLFYINDLLVSFWHL